MRVVFRILAFAVAGMVVVQAAVMVWAVAGLGIFVEDGGVVDSATMEQALAGDSPFPESVGLVLHGMNGMTVIPVLAVLLLVASFFAGVRGAWRWGLAVLLLVILQAALGLAGHSVPFLGALHGVNALLLFSAAFYAGWRVAAVDRASARPAVVEASGPVPAEGLPS
ncbi:hypothetical protein GCM10009809_35580 [Isoptericola hypogeus]|uniref:Cytochrome c oxidase assembly protein subunit 15 n=1 Tax=Isoptericola hypogeus TaxID=300179 RepID=A0ABP4VUT6_9MICO